MMFWFLSKKILCAVLSEIQLFRCNIISTGQSVRALKKLYSNLGTVLDARILTSFVNMKFDHNLELKTFLNKFLSVLGHWRKDKKYHDYPSEFSLELKKKHITIIVFYLFEKSNMIFASFPANTQTRLNDFVLQEY